MHEYPQILVNNIRCVLAEAQHSAKTLIQRAEGIGVIHCNTLKYRLGVIKNLGYDISDTTYTFLPLYMSLYLYDIGLVQI